MTFIDLTHGFKNILWQKSREEVLKAYPHAITTLSMRGRNSENKETIHLPQGLMIPDILHLPSFSLWGHVNFHEGKVVGIDLYPHVTFPHRHLPAYIRRALIRLNKMFAITIAADGDALQQFTQNNVHFEIHLHRTDFMLSFYAPNTEPLLQQNYIHRSFRRSQAQRCFKEQKLPPIAWPQKDEKIENKEAEEEDT